jgi:hypothetical protein
MFQIFIIFSLYNMTLQFEVKNHEKANLDNYSVILYFVDICPGE